MGLDRSEIVVILDRSGSMQAAKKDHEGGLNSFVQDQRTLAGHVNFTLIQFDTQDACEVVYDGVPVAQVGPCELIPRGGTPLLDAIGRGVAHVRSRIDTASPAPDQVLVMIITDGEENSSREFKKDAIKSLIAEREAAGWKFLFLGANIDAFADAGAMGMSHAGTMNFSNKHIGVVNTYAAASSNTLAARSFLQSGGDREGAYQSYTWTDQQRADAMREDETSTTTNVIPPTTTNTTTTATDGA